MSTLILTAHPDTRSLTHGAAQRLHDVLGTRDSALAHLAQEGFDPRFTQNDREVYLGGGTSDPDIRAEQDRLDRVTDLVLVFPVYWWSMPALLKGWIDRVFIAGWAFDYDEADRVVPKLGRLTSHLLPVSGTAVESFTRHGYTRSFETQIECGIFDFCGVQRGSTAFIHDSETADEHATQRLETAVAEIAAAITGADGPVDGTQAPA